MRERIGVLLVLFVVLLDAANADDLQSSIARLNGVVATAREKEVVANQVRDNLRRRLQQANEKSTAEWRSVRTLEDWQRFRTEKRDELRKSLGPWPDRKSDLQIEKTGQFAGSGFQIQNILYESRPGWWVSANLYLPEQPRESMPGIVIGHAHHTPKHDGELQDMGMTWARAGCLVLIPDQVGHGERRQHPFHSASDYAKPFGVGRQDYYFRYDNAVQLHLVGESLAGWMAWDLSCGMDVLLKQPGVDPDRILLLGAVAGGGDPAAIAGSLDERFAAVVPFNFGGPQPETPFPLPDDIEQTFNYAGSGGWESTRNLAMSAEHRFLPWAIVGTIAPRRLIYAHEFSWDRERDPVWKRLQSIYGLYEKPDHLTFTHGRGVLKDRPPVATHCNHIGTPHRVRIHEAFKAWFQIDVTPEAEYSARVPVDRLKCWTQEARQKLRPKSLSDITTQLADELIATVRDKRIEPEQRREQLQMRWDTLLGGVAAERLKAASQRVNESSMPQVESWMLTAESEIQVPCLVLRPEKTDRHQPVVLAICSQGKDRLLKERAADLAALLQGGATVYLIDPRGLGESKLGDSHTRRSSATSHTSTGLMLGTPLLGEQLRDLRMVLNWIRRRSDVGFRPIVIWGESLILPNADDAAFRTPRDDDQTLPAVSEPQAPMLALLLGLFEDDLDAVYTVGGIVSWRSILENYLVLTAHDVIVPGALTAGEISDIVVAQQPTTRIRMEAMVDGWNRMAGNHLKRLQSGGAKR